MPIAQLIQYSVLYCMQKMFRETRLTMYLVYYSLSIQVIKQDNDDTDSCFTALLTHWLSRPNPPPTWSVLIAAIKSRPIGYVDVANQIEAMLAEKSSPSSPWLYRTQLCKCSLIFTTIYTSYWQVCTIMLFVNLLGVERMYSICTNTATLALTYTKP